VPVPSTPAAFGECRRSSVPALSGRSRSSSVPCLPRLPALNLSNSTRQRRQPAERSTRPGPESTTRKRRDIAPPALSPQHSASSRSSSVPSARDLPR